MDIEIKITMNVTDTDTAEDVMGMLKIALPYIGDNVEISWKERTR